MGLCLEYVFVDHALFGLKKKEGLWYSLHWPRLLAGHAFSMNASLIACSETDCFVCLTSTDVNKTSITFNGVCSLNGVPLMVLTSVFCR